MYFVYASYGVASDKRNIRATIFSVLCAIATIGHKHAMLTPFRVIKSADFHGKTIPHPNTLRPPSFVPYLVDNIWEWLRPEQFPSRRKCAFASPTPELAFAGAKITANHRNEYVVTTVTFPGKFSIAQVSLRDALGHPDVKALPKEILEFLGPDWTQQPAGNRLDIAPLFMPVISREEVDEALRRIKRGDELREIIRKTSKFWENVKLLSLTDDLAYPEGEIFFEALDGYRLNHISEAQK